jgi:diguanylate cyclase (GGDEF)-like protein
MSRVLIIDDNEAIHADFRKILGPEPSGSGRLAGAKAALFGLPDERGPARVAFELSSALQGQAGLAMVKESLAANNPFAVAFVDMRMPPGWDGLETIRHLWGADPALQVVICSAYSDHSWEEISSTLGLTDRLLILKKPFDPVEVSQLAVALSEKWRLSKQATLKLEELEKLVEQRTSALSHMAMHDKLTGLPNRFMLKERLGRIVERSASGKGSFSVCFLDFDRFKIVNDSLGHDAGDHLLSEIATRLNACLASGEHAGWDERVAARIGGDEFVVVVAGPGTEAGAVRIGEALLTWLASPYQVKGYNLTSSASIGITTSERGYTTADEVLRDADTAMYHAKAAGKARYVVFDQRMHAEMKQRLEFETELAGVVERKDLRLHYQPIVSIESGELRGFEALVRWKHPQRGLIPPAQFINVAEETGAIVTIGNWVLNEACRQLAEWNRGFSQRRDLVMSVNVSARQLATPTLVTQVASTMREHGIAPGQLVIEITESAIIKDPDSAADILNQIKDLGVGVSMDDFGTGYTSISHLHRLPLTCLKMDRSFMQTISERRDVGAVVHAIVNLAQNLRITVVAEGVETPEQLALLQSMECDWAQGYLFGRPVEPDAAAQFIVAPPGRLAA